MKKLSKSDFLICLGIMLVQEFTKMLQVWSFRKRLQSNFWYYLSCIGLLFCIGILTDQKCQKCLSDGLNLILELVFLEINRLVFFLKTPNLNHSTCDGTFRQKSFVLPCNGILMDQNCQKILVVLTCQDIQTHISSAPIVSFSIKLSINTPLREADYLFPNIMKNIYYVEIGVLVDQKWQKYYSYWVVSLFHLTLLDNYRFEFLYQGLNWQW